MPVSDRVMLHVLRSVQIAQLTGGDARRISFRDIDVEQIGYIYEGLLGYTCAASPATSNSGLVGSTGAEPEIPLTTLEQLADSSRPRQRSSPPRSSAGSTTTSPHRKPAQRRRPRQGF